ncbi:glycerol-3-phosphate dehydrogenase/oxidase [Gephyromycinifex aptenodytis]|uniref:glycerol-3-phosphate dehydrogenase/oxidase n=1 Tax=Gephyromycinifex aptenodytis TaxID=2716227 RepID=UPI001447C32E|nr:glycerol-3-phosphate dehydrogenase/oxidase [Gephyromycinifex aptenodytis]
MRSTVLSPSSRQAALAQLASGPELDILVVGGGITGAGVALDAVARGLSTGLLEARDYASGTSSRSSKLIHGGLRYLEMLDFGLVHEALQERGRLLDVIAPHLVRPVPFLFPFTHRGWERLYIGAGVGLYDAMAHLGGNGAGLPLQKHLTRRAALRLFPGLKPHAFTGALQYYDAQVDDARLVVEIIRTAASFGALVANRVEVVDFLRQGARVTGVRARDRESGAEFEIRARQVINATGVWTDDTQRMLAERGTFKVRASKGVHIVVPRDRINSSTGLILRTEKSVLFVIPWGRHWIVGTTDTPWEHDKSHPAATRADIDYILDHVNTVLSTPLGHDDVEGVYAGLRPLLSGESDSTSKLSREHIVTHTAPGLVVVAGGKYTTYRVMAKDAVDEAVNALARKVPESTTANLPLIGAQGYRALRNQRDSMAADSGLHPARVEHLLARYGSLTPELLDMVREDPSLATPLPGAQDYLGVEAAYAAAHEGALHLDDILARRTRISIEAWDRGVEASARAAEIVAPILGWSDEYREHEVELYLERVQAERESQTQPDDESADRARLRAREVTGGWTHR